jgi:nucleotidyltransferase substrate binding protein (TIGR01987 family)
LTAGPPAPHLPPYKGQGGAMNSSTLDLGSLRRAIASLRDAQEVVTDTAWLNRQSPPVRNTLLAGVIQNFEFVYELSVRMLKRRIELDSATPGEVDMLNFRDLLRVAGEMGLIANVVAWFTYRQMRNITAHTYDPEKAQQIHLGVPAFIDDAEALLARLESRNE